MDTFHNACIDAQKIQNTENRLVIFCRLNNRKPVKTRSCQLVRTFVHTM